VFERKFYIIKDYICAFVGVLLEQNQQIHQQNVYFKQYQEQYISAVLTSISGLYRRK